MAKHERTQYTYCLFCIAEIVIRPAQARNGWGGYIYPMVPEPEIVGQLSKVGDQVAKAQVDDFGYVGCF